MKLNKQTDALIVVDVQVDFLPGGALGVEDGDRIIPVVNRVTPLFEEVVFSRDWHPHNHISFSDDPQFVDGSWPPHCIGGTYGATFHRDLDLPSRSSIISKAKNPDKEAYSAFEATNLSERLKQDGVERLFIVGLATNYCVKWTANDALEAGFEVVVIEDGVAGIDVPEGAVDEAKQELKDNGVTFIHSSELEGSARAGKRSA